MTTNARPPAPTFSVWSPVVAVAGALVAASAPGWMTAVVFGVAVVCALPFRNLRAVVPLALLTWTVGWLAAIVLSLVEGGLVGLFVVK